MTQQRQTIKRALVSVSDKTGIVDLARGLALQGVEIISTGGTMKLLREQGLQVTGISTFTGSPEVMDGRVKTLHPKIHGGILHRRNVPKDVEELELLEARPIDLVVVNLYPFEETIRKEGVTESEAIEQIDIGGPSMIRSAAKNWVDVTVVVDPADYPALLAETKAHGGATSIEFRKQCAAKAFNLTARYDTAIGRYFESLTSQPNSPDLFPQQLQIEATKKSTLRYGENPHQTAALYADLSYRGVSLLQAEILSGKELSYNNYADLEACLDLLLEFDSPFACIVKHANPCGAATASRIDIAFKQAYESDPLSAFGSIIGLNRPVDLACATLLHETEFIECLVAPDFSAEALELLTKKKNRRFLKLPTIGEAKQPERLLLKQIRGGLLAQQEDKLVTDRSRLSVVTKRSPSDAEIDSLLFGWKIVKQTKSNAIVLAVGQSTVGIGMGQTSRVDSVQLAIKRAGDRTVGSTMASDAFFPMPDSIIEAARVGVAAIIQPGGSKADPDVIAAADSAGIAMVFTGTRHFKH